MSVEKQNFETEWRMASSSTLKKAIWTHAHHKIFIDLCLEQTFEGNKPGTHFNKLGWRNIVHLFYEKTGLHYDKTQMKNHWDMTKAQWKAWTKLIGDSNMKWDPITNKFGATVEDWENYIQVCNRAVYLFHLAHMHMRTHTHTLLLITEICHRQTQKLQNFSLRNSSSRTNWKASLMELCRLKLWNLMLVGRGKTIVQVLLLVI